VTNEFNCTKTDSLVVQAILQRPADFLRAADSICSFQQTTITPTSAFTKYSWSTGSADRSITVEQPGLYKLTVTDGNGCSGSDSIMLARKDCAIDVFVPTAFTPGNDGVNDLFRAQVFGEVVSFSLKVFDRAGQVVFQTENPTKGWDGSVFGRNESTRVYVWQCIYQLAHQPVIIKKGTVTLIR
jgi:gliding motility-associated-like protein